jgi:hypothetical protein
MAAMENEATLIRLAYGGTYHYKLDRESSWSEIYGCGHHGPDCIGKASERNGKGMRYTTVSMPKSVHIV